MPSRRPRYEFALGRPREPALGGSSYVGASRWIWEIELSFRQVKGLQQVRRFEQLTGLMRRRHFRLPMRRPRYLGSSVPIILICAKNQHATAMVPLGRPPGSRWCDLMVSCERSSNAGGAAHLTPSPTRDKAVC